MLSRFLLRQLGETYLRNDSEVRELLRERLNDRDRKSVTAFHTLELAIFIIKTGEVQATLQELAAMLDLSVSSVRRVVRKLQDADVITVQRMVSQSGGQAANCYAVTQVLLTALKLSRASCVASRVSTTNEIRDPEKSPEDWDDLNAKLVSAGFSTSNAIIEFIRSAGFSPADLQRFLSMQKPDRDRLAALLQMSPSA